MKKKCKKCGKKLQSNNICGYCTKCKKTIIYYCIEPNCNEEVSGPDRRCSSHATIHRYSDPKEREKMSRKGKKNGNYKHGNCIKGKIYYCIESNCNEEVSKGGNRCQKCGSKRNKNNYKHGYYCKDKIYHCIEPDCNEEVCGPDRRCKKHGYKVGALKRIKPKQPKPIYHCIEPNCDKEVSGYNKLCPSHARRGDRGSNWRGGITSLVSLIRHLPESKQWRKSIFTRDNYTCQDCGKRGIEIHPHHKKQFAIILQEFLQQYSQFSPIEDKETLVRLAITYEPFWDINNGITLCKDCHKKIKHNKKPTIKRGN